MSDEVQAILRCPPGRRVAAFAALVLLGGLVLWMAAFRPPGDGLIRVLMLLCGGLVFMLATRFWTSTAKHLILTKTELSDSSGQTLCTLDNIRSVQSGAFAFKPSNGLMIHTHTPVRTRWVPGLWWSMGRRIGIGGTVAASEARGFSQALEAIRPNGQAKS